MSQDPSRSSHSGDLPDAVLAALTGGNKIEAIKLLREARGIGLKEAKNAVEAYARDHPALQRKLEARQAESTRGCLLWLAALIAIATVAYYVIAGK